MAALSIYYIFLYTLQMNLAQNSLNSSRCNIDIWNKTIKNLNINNSNFLVFLKFSTFENKTSEQCKVNLLQCDQLMKLHKILNILHKKYVNKDLALGQLIGHWGLLSYLFPQRTGLFLNQIFLLLTENQLVKNMYPEQQRYEVDQTIRILMNAQWKKDQLFTNKISILLNMPDKTEQVNAQVQNSFKILGILCQEEEFSFLIKRVIRVLQNYKIIQKKQQNANIPIDNIIFTLKQPIFPQKNYVISQPDSFIMDMYNVFNDDQITKIQKYDSLDEKKLQYQSKFEQSQSTVSFSKMYGGVSPQESQTRSLIKRSISPKMSEVRAKLNEPIAIKRPKKNYYKERMMAKYKNVVSDFKRIQPVLRQKKQYVNNIKKEKEKLKNIFRKTYIDSTTEKKQKRKMVQQNHEEFNNQNQNRYQQQQYQNDNESSYQIEIQNKRFVIQQSEEITMKRNPYKKVPQQRKKVKHHQQKIKHRRIRQNNNNNQNQIICDSNSQDNNDDINSNASQKYYNNRHIQQFQNSITRQYPFNIKSKQQKKQKFSYLQQNKQNKYSSQKQKITNYFKKNADIFYENIEDMQIRCPDIKATTISVNFDPRTYANYINCLNSQKQIKKQVFQIVKQYLSIEQHQSKLKWFRKVFAAYTLSIKQNQNTHKYWKFYTQHYILSLIQNFIFQQVSKLLAQQINILFTSQQNQNIQFLNRHLSVINFIFQECKFVEDQKTRNKLIVNITQWIYNQFKEVFRVTSQQNDKQNVSSVLKQNIGLIKNPNAFQNQLRISLKPIDQFTSIFISLLLLDSFIIEIAQNKLDEKDPTIYRLKNDFWLKQVCELLKKNISQQSNKQSILKMYKLTNQCFEVAKLKNKTSLEAFILKCKIISQFLSYLKKISDKFITHSNSQLKGIRQSMYSQLMKCLNKTVTCFIQREIIQSNSNVNALHLINKVTKQTALKDFIYNKDSNNINAKKDAINLSVTIQIYKAFLTFSIFIQNQQFFKKNLIKDLQNIEQYLLNNQKANYDSSFLIGYWQIILQIYKIRLTVDIWSKNDLFLKQNFEDEKLNVQSKKIWSFIQRHYLFIQRKYYLYNAASNSSHKDQQEKTKKYASIIQQFIKNLFQAGKISYNFDQQTDNEQIKKNVFMFSIPHYFNLVSLLGKVSFFKGYHKLHQNSNQQQFSGYLIDSNRISNNNFIYNKIINLLERIQHINQLLKVQEQINLKKNASDDEQIQDQMLVMNLWRRGQNHKIIQTFFKIINKNCKSNHFQIDFPQFNFKNNLQGIIHTILQLSKFYTTISNQGTQNNKSDKNDILNSFKKFQSLNIIKVNQKIMNPQQIREAQNYFGGMAYFICKYLAMASSKPDGKRKAQIILRKQPFFSDKHLNLVGSLILTQIFLNRAEGITEIKKMFAKIFQISLQRQNNSNIWSINRILHQILNQFKTKTLNFDQFLQTFHRLSISQANEANKSLSQFSKTSIQIFQSILILLKQNISSSKNVQAKSNLIKNLLKTFNIILRWPELLPQTIKKYFYQIQPNSQEDLIKYFKPSYQNLKLIVQTLQTVQKMRNVHQIKQKIPKIMTQSIIKQILNQKSLNQSKQTIHLLQSSRQQDKIILFNNFIQIFDYLEKIFSQSGYSQTVQNFAKMLCQQFLKPITLKGSHQKYQKSTDKKFQQNQWMRKEVNHNLKCQIVLTFMTIIKQSDILRKQLQGIFNEKVYQIQEIVDFINLTKNVSSSQLTWFQQCDTMQSIIKKCLIGKNSDFYLLKALVNTRIQKNKTEAKPDKKQKIMKQIQAILQKIIKVGQQALQQKQQLNNIIGLVNSDLCEWFFQKLDQVRSSMKEQRPSLQRHSEMELQH